MFFNKQEALRLWKDILPLGLAVGYTIGFFVLINLLVFFFGSNV